MRLEWDEYFLQIASVVALRSHDAETCVGCVLVGPDHRILGTGYNGFPPGFPDDALPVHRPDKYPYMVHAEVNALVSVAKDLTGATCYCTISPCIDCTKMLLTARIARVVCREIYANSDWDKVCELLQLGLVEVRVLSAEGRDLFRSVPLSGRPRSFS